MSLSNTIDFFSKSCKNGEHSKCHGSWSGLGFQCNCECSCHSRKNDAIDKGLEPASIAYSTATSEEPQR